MDNSANSPECLAHHDTQNIHTRKDFWDLCAYDKGDFNNEFTKNGKKAKNEPDRECMAKILYLLEDLTNQAKKAWKIKYLLNKEKGLKLPKEQKEYKIELSYTMISSMLYEIYSISTIYNSIAVLIQRGYIKRYHKSKTSTSLYVLNIPVLQAALDRQAGKDQAQENDHAEPLPTTNQYLPNERQLEVIGHTKKKYTEDELKPLSEEQRKTRLSRKMQETFKNWCSIHKGPIPLIPKRFLALQDLEPFDTSIEILRAVLKFCYETDKLTKQYPKGYYHTRGVDLWDIAERYPSWHQTREYQGPPVLTIVSNTQGQVYSSVDEDYDYAAEFYPTKPAIK